jgi:type IV secretory pathway TraG/TraD family ATPase VirD4
MFIDLKGDMETICKFSGYLAECDRIQDLFIFSLSDQKVSLPYNMILDGTATQLRDRIMMSLVWSEEFYKNQSASFLLKLLIGLCWLRDNQKRGFHLGTILDCLNNPERIEELSLLIPQGEGKVKGLVEDCFSFLGSSENFKSLQGLRTQLESLVLSDFGDLIASNDPGINLFEAVTQGKIVFIFLDSRRYGETAKTVGRFILQDLKSASAKVDAEVPKSERRPFSVIIDEFADLAQEDFISFLDRARSASMSIVVAHQEICDLERISPEFAGRLMGNTSTLYAFLQKRPESAEIISGMAGTQTVWKQTKQTERFGFFELESGGGSKREVEELVIHPNLIKSLRVGKCVCVKKYPTARAYIVEVSNG